MSEFAESLRRTVVPQLRKQTVQKTIINLVALVLICFAAASQSDVFFSWLNFQNIGQQIAVVVIIGMPFTMLMVSGAFDLSIGSNLALSGTVAALLSQHMPIPEAFILASLVGLLVGLINALLVVGMGINSFIATIGTLYVARGVALLLSGGTEVSSVGAGYSKFGTTFLFGGDISIFIPIWVAVLLVFVGLQRSTSFGRYTVAAGSNEEASFLSGVPVKRTRILGFALTGLAAGFAGVLQSSQLGLGSPTGGVGLEFQVIVAAVVGGTSLFGGEGRVLGTFLGAFIVGAIFNGLNLAEVPSYWQTVSLGVILIVAVGIDRLVRNPHLGRALKRLRVRRDRIPPGGPPPPSSLSMERLPDSDPGRSQPIERPGAR